MDMDYVEGLVSETGEDAAKKVLTPSLNSMIPLASQTTTVGDFVVPQGRERLVGMQVTQNDRPMKM